MKLLFVLVPPLNPLRGGVERTTCKLGKYFSEQGIEVSYFSFASSDHVCVKHGILHHSVKEGGVENPDNRMMLSTCIEDIEPDIVINQMPYEIILSKFLAEKRESVGFVLIGCLRNSLFSVVNNIDDYIRRLIPGAGHSLFKNPIGRKLALIVHWINHRRYLRIILSLHDRFVLLAPPNIEELNFFVGNFKREKVLVIPNSIPEVKDCSSTKSNMLLHVGRLDVSQKKSDLLLPIWKKCVDELPDWEFIIVGDGPYKSHMEAQIEKEKIKRVSLVGFQDPKVFYEKASIFMMPSAFEGFPNTILEANSFGCPVIAFNSYPALKWIVNDTVDSILIEPYNIDFMASEISRLALNHKEQREFSKEALTNAKRFTINVVGRMWVDFFKNI